MVEKGQVAPDVSLVDSERKTVKISDYKGKPLVLAFYPGAFTGVCTKEMCTFRDSLSKFNSVGATVIGISVDPPFSLKAFKEQNKINFPLLSDYNREAVKAYGVAAGDFAGLKGYTAAKRSVFILDKEGKIAYKWVTENPGVEPDYAEVQKVVSELH
ncbi:MAG: peroxiredoxin [Thermoprotei archaeon]